MDYSQYKVLEFRRKFFKLFGASISMMDPMSNMVIGFIQMKAFRWRGDIRLYTNEQMQQEVIRIGAKQVLSFKPSYDVFDSASGVQLMTLRFRALKTYLVRGHMDIIDTQGNEIGYVQETSSFLAIFRRYIGVFLGDFGELPLAFIPQTFDIMYAPNGAEPQLAGKIVHRKNPIIVKMSLDTTNAQVTIDPKINIAVCSLLSILDANKNA